MSSNKLVCLRVMDGDKEHDTPGSEIKGSELLIVMTAAKVSSELVLRTPNHIE